MKINQMALPLLKDRQRYLQKRITAMDKLCTDGKLTIESLNNICRSYRKELAQINSELRKRTCEQIDGTFYKKLTHNPFKKALEKKA